MNPQSIGEASITPDIINNVAPDAVSNDGKQKLFNKLATATVEKPGLDAIFKAIATKYNGEFISRVKDPKTVVQKIAQKRIQGRDYETEDINDAYGSRLTIDKKNFPKAIKDIEKVSDALGFTIHKSEDASHSTYSAHHLDMQTPSGGKFEVQLMTPKAALEATANHTLRAVHGEEPQNPQVEKLKQAQASIANKTPDNTANATTQALQAIAQKQGGQVSPIQSAQLLTQAQQRG